MDKKQKFINNFINKKIKDTSPTSMRAQGFWSKKHSFDKEPCYNLPQWDRNGGEWKVDKNGKKYFVRNKLTDNEMYDLMMLAEYKYNEKIQKEQTQQLSNAIVKTR